MLSFGASVSALGKIKARAHVEATSDFSPSKSVWQILLLPVLLAFNCQKYYYKNSNISKSNFQTSRIIYFHIPFIVRKDKSGSIMAL